MLDLIFRFLKLLSLSRLSTLILLSHKSNKIFFPRLFYLLSLIFELTVLYTSSVSTFVLFSIYFERCSSLLPSSKIMLTLSCYFHLSYLYMSLLMYLLCYIYYSCCLWWSTGLYPLLFFSRRVYNDLPDVCNNFLF